MYNLKIAVISALGCLVLSACSVTPIAISDKERAILVKADMQSLFSDQEAIKAPITLYDAMARSIKYNLDHRLSLLEKTVSKRQLDVSHYDLLPTLTAEAGYNQRSNYTGATSRSLLTGDESLEASTSQELEHTTRRVNLVWNVLDFGVSYVRAQQQANQVLIREEQRKKVVQNIVQDVRAAYWRAASAQRLLGEMDKLLHRSNQALQRAKMLESLRLKKPLQTLHYQKALLDIVRQMWNIRQDLSTAKTELAALMNLRPGTEYEIDISEGDLRVVGLEVELEVLETYALHHRPELNEGHYQSRISALEVKKTMLRSMPGLELNFSPNKDSNSFLFHKQWNEAGASISWNLFNIVSAGARLEEAESRQELEKMRRLSLGMAVLTQVNLAWQRYQLEAKNFSIIKDIAGVEKRIKDQVLAEKQAQTQTELEVIRTLAGELVARMQKERSYAELQNARARIYNSIGLDPLPVRPKSNDLAALSDAIKTTMESWNNGAGLQ